MEFGRLSSLQSQLDALRAQVGRLIEGGKLRQLGSGTDRIGVIQTHPHTGTGEGGLLESISARMYATATQSINNATFTVREFDTEDYDTDGSLVDLANNKMVIQTAGKYICVASAGFVANTTEFRILRIYKGADWFAESVVDNAGGTAGTVLSCSAIIDCAVNDEITIKVYQFSGGALNANFEGKANPSLAIAMIGT